MSEEGHTPGPWKLHELEDGFWLWQEGHDPRTSENGEGYVLGPIDGFRRADLDLIAAAPDLLEALTGLLRVDRGFDGRGPWLTARAAIAKATGEER